MITKERLKELIEQGATIYEVDTFGVNDIILKQGDYVEENGVLHTQVIVGGYNYFYDERLFEAKIDAEWHKEFGCIERTERLELPTWEEFNEKKFVWFFDKDHKSCCLHYLGCSNQIFINVDGDVIGIGDLTKETYNLACRKCKELFLGEKE